MEACAIQQMIAQYAQGEPSGEIDMERFGHELVSSYLILLTHCRFVYFEGISPHVPPNIS